jgi:hypothetical protein
MSRSKELWTAECERVCEDYQNGKISREVAIKELRWRGWSFHDATDELDEWANA